MKFSAALIIIGLAFWIFLARAGVQSRERRLDCTDSIRRHHRWADYSPVGISLATKLAPRRTA